MHQEDRKSQKLKESQKDDRAQLVFMKKQLSLLEEIKGHLVKREENFLYYQTDQQRKDAQKSKEQYKAKESNVKTFKQRRSERFKNFKNKIDRKDSRGIHSSQEIEKKRIFSEV